MSTQRWLCKELNPIDLFPERDLITFFITTPKLADIASDFQQFKSQKYSSKKNFLLKYRAPPQPKNFVIAEGPRFCKELPEPINVNLLRSTKSKKKISKSPINEAENIIEGLIRNRQELTLPTIEEPSPVYSNIKERFIKTKSRLLHDKKVRCDVCKFWSCDKECY